MEENSEEENPAVDGEEKSGDESSEANGDAVLVFCQLSMILKMFLVKRKKEG